MPTLITAENGVVVEWKTELEYSKRAGEHVALWHMDLLYRRLGDSGWRCMELASRSRKTLEATARVLAPSLPLLVQL